MHAYSILIRMCFVILVIPVPPMPTILPTELYCDVSLKEYRPVVIKWMVGWIMSGVVCILAFH